jgi:hypothetical protein
MMYMEIHAQLWYVNKKTLARIAKERRTSVGGPTEVGWYIVVGDADRPLGIYPKVFKTKEEAAAGVEKAILEFAEAQGGEVERTLH